MKKALFCLIKEVEIFLETKGIVMLNWRKQKYFLKRKTLLCLTEENRSISWNERHCYAWLKKTDIFLEMQQHSGINYSETVWIWSPLRASQWHVTGWTLPSWTCTPFYLGRLNSGFENACPRNTERQQHCWWRSDCLEDISLFDYYSGILQ